MATVIGACGGNTSGGTTPTGDDGGTGGTSSSGGGTGGTGGSCGGTGSSSSGGPSCGGAHPAPTGRPSDVACPATPPVSNAPDAAAPSCTTLTDCTGDGGINISPYGGCLNGVCSRDQCLLDSDCGSGMLCACTSQLGYRGNAIQSGNQCIATNCRLDSDCGSGGVCSPSNGDSCGGLSGFFCHSAADTCLTNADCCGSTPSCVYQPTLGHWACQAVSVCTG